MSAQCFQNVCVTLCSFTHDWSNRNIDLARACLLAAFVFVPALFLFLLFLVLFWKDINNPTIRLMMIGYYTALFVCDVTVNDGAMNALSSFRVPLRSNIGFYFSFRFPIAMDLNGLILYCILFSGAKRTDSDCRLVPWRHPTTRKMSSRSIR